MNRPFNNIEKYIDPSRLDMELLPDIEDDSVEKYLYVNKDGEPEWKAISTADNLDDIITEINVTKGKIELLVKKIEEVQTNTENIYKEFYTSVTVELNKINLSISNVSDMVTTNKDLFEQYVKDNDSAILEIGKIIEISNTQIELLNQRINLIVENSEIIGSYLPGSNDPPTSSWHNQVNPFENSSLINFLFEQDSGWVKSSAVDNYFLMFAGSQRLELNNILKDSYSVFTIDAWIKPYNNSVCSILDGIFLYDNNGNITIRNDGIEALTFYQLSTGVISHVCFVIDCNKGSIKIYINGEEITVNLNFMNNIYTLPDKLSLFNGFNGEVYSFKVYKTSLPKERVDQNFKQTVNGFMVYKAYLTGYFEARCAKAILSDFEHMQSSIEVLKNSISLKVSEAQYREDMDGVNSRISSAEIKLQPNSIMLVVTSSKEWTEHLREVDDKFENLETAYSIMLSNDSQVISTDSNRYPLADKVYKTQVTVYKGANDITAECDITAPPTASGIIVEKESHSVITFTVNNSIQIGAPLSSDGTFDIKIKIKEINKEFTKQFIWAISKQGENGQDGQDGTSVVIKGSYTLEQWLLIKDELAKTAIAGDSYIVDGSLFVFDGTIFVDCGNIKGQDGENAQFVRINGEQCFKYPSETNIPSPKAIVLTCLAVNISNPIYQWSYLDSTSNKYIDIIGSTSSIYHLTPDDRLWGESHHLTLRCTCNNKFDEMTIVKVFDGEQGETYRVEIISTNGNIFKNGIINTTLHAILYKNERNITDEVNASCFKWSKINSDGTQDEEWNTKYFGGVKSVSITSSDVYARASFVCNIDI